MDSAESKRRISEEGLLKYRHNLGDRPMRDDEIGHIVTLNKWKVYQSHEKIQKEYDDHRKEGND